MGAKLCFVAGIFAARRAVAEAYFAIHPSIICRFGSHVFVNGKQVVKAKIVDKMHRVLPVWKGCKALTSTQYFVLGHHRDSFDGRYFGPIEQRQVVGTAFAIAELFN